MCSSYSPLCCPQESARSRLLGALRSLDATLFDALDLLRRPVVSALPPSAASVDPAAAEGGTTHSDSAGDAGYVALDRVVKLLAADPVVRGTLCSDSYRRMYVPERTHAYGRVKPRKIAFDDPLPAAVGSSSPQSLPHESTTTSTTSPSVLGEALDVLLKRAFSDVRRFEL